MPRSEAIEHCPGVRVFRACVMLAGLLPCAAAGPAHAQVFKCVDPQGHVAYQATRCPAGAVQSTQALRGVYYRCEAPDGSAYLRLDGCVARSVGGAPGRITHITDDAGQPVMGREGEVPPNVDRWYDPRRRQWLNVQREPSIVETRVDPGRPVTHADACEQARAARRRLESDPDRTLSAIRAAEATEAHVCAAATALQARAADSAPDPSRSGWTTGRDASRRETPNAACDLARANLDAVERDPDRTMRTIRAAQSAVEQACR